MDTLYGVLGVDKSADEESIKTAYYKAASEHHPDRGGNHDKMTDITRAAAVLLDPEKRRKYDKELEMLGELCPSCKGAGRTFKQKGFTNKIPKVCDMCGGNGILRWKSRTKKLAEASVITMGTTKRNKK
jgi:DnaJ-class molecular chaperone